MESIKIGTCTPPLSQKHMPFETHPLTYTHTDTNSYTRTCNRIDESKQNYEVKNKLLLIPKLLDMREARSEQENCFRKIVSRNS